MEEVSASLRAALLEADDEYLTGLSNKGTLNRGRKDLQALSPSAQAQGEELLVTLGAETCTLRVPLGDSACTCPARGVCRHLVSAILWAKAQLGQEAAPSAAESLAAPSAAEESSVPSAGSEAPVQEAPAEPKAHPSTEPEVPAREAPAAKEEPPRVSLRDFTPLLDYPFEQLRRAMGAKRLSRLAARLQEEGLPPMEEGSVVTVRLPWEPAVVRLLIPPEHSSCSCHSRELCPHKAEAILLYQIAKGRLDPGELTAQEEEVWDAQALRGVTDAVCGAVAAQLRTGVSRLPPSAEGSMERLAAMAHSARLPELERSLRTAASMLGRYFSRSAAYRDKALLSVLADVFDRAQRLRAASEGELAALAGSFREEYLPCPPLRLTLLGEREFHAASGYEGRVYYFWETRESRFYTWTAARPTIYDAPRRRVPGAFQAAPWQLEGTMARLYGVSIELRDGRAARGRRLSSSGESRAAVTGSLDPWDALPPERQYTDFSRLLRDLRPHLPDGPEADRVALLLPRFCGAPSFDRVSQTFCLPLWDAKLRRLVLEVRYRKEEQAVVDALERFAEKAVRRRKQSAFLVLCSLDGDALRFYPIEVYAGWGRHGARPRPASLPAGVRLHAARPGLERMPGKLRLPHHAGKGRLGEDARSLRGLLGDLTGALADLLQSGADSLPPESADRMEALARQCEDTGLHTGAALFTRLGELLQSGRHQLSPEPLPLAEAVSRAARYVTLCRERLALDAAEEDWNNETEQNETEEEE